VTGNPSVIMGHWKFKINKLMQLSLEPATELRKVNAESEITNPAYQKWINAGYQQFAMEGLDGILVERMARMLHLNKSGFYYYFGDRDYYLDQLYKFHIAQCEAMASEMRLMKSFDPDFILIIMKHKLTTLVQMQLLRFRHIESCITCYRQANQRLDKEILPGWSDFIGIQNDSALATQYLSVTRDCLYARITSGNASSDFVKSLIYEVKDIAQGIRDKEITSV